MSQDKYLIFRTADIQRYLDTAWHQAVAQIQEAITTGRQTEGKRTDHVMFVLNMSDPFAQEAIKQYIRSAASHPSLVDDIGVQQALAKARDVLNTGTLMSAPQLPN